MNTKLIYYICVIAQLATTPLFSMPTHAPVGVQLIGVYNKLTKNSNAPSANPASVRIKTTRENITGLPWVPQNFLRLPVEIEVLFASKNMDEKGTPQPYIIKLEENRLQTSICSADKTCVIARVYIRQQGDLDMYPESQQTTCVSKSVFFIKKGDLISQWQNVMLFIADPEDQTSHVPFKFGICAWTATHGLWKYDFINHAPADSLTHATNVVFDKKQTTIGNKQEQQGLRVWQGQQAWGGGQIPRAYFLHIAHIYNNTHYQILARRTVRELSAYNFVKIIPPYSVIPFAMAWIPKITTDEALLPRLDPIHIFVLRTAKNGALPAAFTGIDDIGGTEIETSISENDINSAVDAIVQNMTPTGQELAGYAHMISDLKKDPQDAYIIGKNSYKIFAIKGATINEAQTLCINKCIKGTQEEEMIYQSTDPTYHGILPKYSLRLIINETQPPASTEDLVSFDLANISYETVFES